MIKIKNIMIFIENKLSEISLLPVYYEDMIRQEDGSIELKSTNIVYNIEGSYDVANMRIRRDIPIIIDIWFLKKDIFSVEDLINKIDNEFSEEVILIDGIIYKVFRDIIFYSNIPEQDEKIGRKRLRYTIRNYRS